MPRTYYTIELYNELNIPKFLLSIFYENLYDNIQKNGTNEYIIRASPLPTTIMEI